MKRTPEEITAEIAALKECKTYAPHYTIWHEDNHKAIDDAIEELEHGIDHTADEFHEMSLSSRCMVDMARDWKNGDADSKPSAEWDHFKP